MYMMIPKTLLVTKFLLHIATSLDVQLISTLNGELHCVATGNDYNSAISWDYWNFPPSTINQSIYLKPDLQPDLAYLNATCTFSDEEHCTNYWTNKAWKTKSSLKYNFGLVLDRRWENFEAVQTEYCDFGKGISIENSQNFEVPISIRASRNVHIRLCGNDAEGGNCYRIIIGLNFRKPMIMKKCIYDTSSYDVTCKTVDELKDTNNLEPILQKDKWSHFTISVNNSTISIHQVNKEKPILEWTSDSKLYLIKNLYVCINDNGSEYKIHKYNLLETSTISKERVGDFSGYQNEANFCIVLYVKMCRHCHMEFSLYSKGVTVQKLNVSQKDDEKNWFEVEFSADINRYKGAKKDFYIETNANDHRETFWRIREVRSCSKNNTEFRVLKYNLTDRNYRPNCLIGRMENNHHNTYKLNLDNKTSQNVYNLGPITNFETYNQGASFVSLHWNCSNSNLYEIVCSDNEGRSCPTHPNIEKCSILPYDYCITYGHLIPNIDYKFSIRAKQNGIFGYKIKDLSLDVNTNIQVPSVPLNPKAYFDEHNSLNVEWQHPAKLNGPLKYFAIDIFYYINQKYRLYYEDRYDGNFNKSHFNKIIPTPVDGWKYYSEPMSVTIRTVNDKGFSDFSNVTVVVPPKIPNFRSKSMIITDITEKSVTLTLPEVGNVDSDHSHMFIVVSTSDGNMTSMDYDYAVLRQKCDIPDEDSYWLAFSSDQVESVQKVEIGNTNDHHRSSVSARNVFNYDLEPDTLYNICVVIMNEYLNLKRFDVAHAHFKTEVLASFITEKEGKELYVYGIAVATVVIVFAVILLLCWKNYSKPVPQPIYRTIIGRTVSGELTRFVVQEDNIYLTPRVLANDPIYEEIVEPRVPVQYDQLNHHFPINKKLPNLYDNPMNELKELHQKK